MTVNKLQQSKDYQLIKLGLNAALVRSSAIAQNIANVNTKDYKRYSVTFEETLKKEQGITLKSTNEKHLSKEQNYGDVEVVQDNSTSMREDGNNVDIDSEKVDQAANALMYNTLINQANSRINNTRYVITGGGR